jgi:hypothetical protein
MSTLTTMTQVKKIWMKDIFFKLQQFGNFDYEKK